MNKKKIFNLVFYLAIPLIFSGIISFVIRDDFSYLDTLNRKIVVPQVVFPIVWSILYIFMGLWAYFYSRDYPTDKRTMVIYWLSLVINLLFSPILFTMHQHLLATIDVAVLFFMILYLFIKTLNKKKKYAYYYVPYLLWLILAFSLMLDILLHN